MQTDMVESGGRMQELKEESLGWVKGLGGNRCLRGPGMAINLPTKLIGRKEQIVNRKFGREEVGDQDGWDTSQPA